MSDADPGTSAGTTQYGFSLPLWFRFVSAVFATALVSPCIIFLWKYSHGSATSKEASDLGITTLLIAGTIVALFAFAPWKSMGLSLRKIGFVEFERVINTQAMERIIDLTELRGRIEKLERVGIDEDRPRSDDVKSQLSKFLREHRRWAFSPLRIQQWGGRQSGYEDLSQVSVGEIREALQQMVARGQLTTRISRRGNTLFKAS